MSDILQEHNPWDKNGLWKHELRRVRDLHPNPKNPRTITEQSLKGLRESLKDNGYTMRLIVDSHNKILSGHARWIIMNQDDPDAVIEVLVAQRELTEQEEKDAILGHNVLGGSWDIESAQMNFDPIDWQKFDLTFDIDDLPGVEKEIIEDEIPEEVETVCKKGDIWQLGEHRLMCGDSTNADDVAKLMNGNKADLLITDPPYNVAYEGKTKEKLTIQNDSMDDQSFRNFLIDAFSVVDKFIKFGGVFYIWHADSEGFNFRYACKETGWKVRQCLIWVKNSMVMGRQDYQWKHEPCLYGWKEGEAHYWGSDRKQTTILEFNKPTKSEQHPTMKPVNLFAYQIKNSSKQGESVLDVFGGSGTSIVACEQLGRKCYTMELDPHYCDVIIARWEKLTGQTAKKEENENI